MAQQAILAAHRRQRERNGRPLGGDGLSREATRSHLALSSSHAERVGQLRLALKENSDLLYQKFRLWDDDDSGALNAVQFSQMCRMIGVKAEPEEFTLLMKMVRATCPCPRQRALCRWLCATTLACEADLRSLRASRSGLQADF